MEGKEGAAVWAALPNGRGCRLEWLETFRVLGFTVLRIL